MFSNDRPIFQQLADQIADGILSGRYAEGSAVPSTNEYASFYRINPATAGKGVNLLVEQGVLYKKRGVGMFVASGAKHLLEQQRRAEFRDQHIIPLVHEAKVLQFSPAAVIDMIKKEYDQ